MKLTKILCQTGLLFSLTIATAAVADDGSVLGSYKSNGYTLDLGSGGDYHSCDPRNRCVTIAHTKSSQQGKIWIWKNAGYTYRVTPVGHKLAPGQHTKVSVKITNPKNQVIFDRIFRSQ